LVPSATPRPIPGAAVSCSVPNAATPTAKVVPDRTLAESDYLLGVADETRLGALRFRCRGEETFQAPIRAGVPALIELSRLLQITERILSPAYDLNPVPTDLKARVLTTNIDLDEGTCSLDLLEAASEFFGLTLAQARAIIKEVATVTAIWRDAAKGGGPARPRSTAWPALSSTTISSERWRFDQEHFPWLFLRQPAVGLEFCRRAQQ